MPILPRPLRPLRLLAATVLLVVGSLRLGPAPEPAGAAVRTASGYRATVLGFSSWYGSYDLGSLGVVWCIDHGIPAPDADLGYVPTVPGVVGAEVRAALAWSFGRYGPGADRVTAAALMLVGHDLMGARYPYGRLDVDALDHRSIAGFGDDGPAVLAAARAVKADALAHAGLRSPWSLELRVEPSTPDRPAAVVARMLAGGAAVAGIDVRLVPPDDDGDVVTTDAAGEARQPVVAGSASPARFTAVAEVPDLELAAFAPTRATAQRVVRPARLTVQAAIDLAPTSTTSTSTTSTSTTTTTVPTTSTTSASTTTTTAPTTSTTPTTATSTTSTTATTAPARSSTTPTPDSPVTEPPTTEPPTTEAPTTTVARGPAPPGPARSLPHTGADPVALGATGSGLVLLGSSLRDTTRRRRR